MVLESAAGAILTEDGRADWQVPIAASASLASAFDQVLSQRLSQLYDPLVLWWSNGSSTITPSCLITKGLPHPDSFAALLDGAWNRRQWRSVAAHVDISHDSGPVDVEDAKPPRFRSAAATDVGRVRTVNQDAFVERTEVGLWAVADGLGGHVDGEVASRMVCDALADFVPDSSFEDAIDGARDRITEVNDSSVSQFRQRDGCGPLRQHGRRAAGARHPLCRRLGGRQPGLPVARRPVRAAHARSQRRRTRRRGDPRTDKRHYARRRGRRPR